MADTLVNTLYPPQVETFQPAFVYTDDAAVTFSISPFNDVTDIHYIHVSVVDQRNNENVLKGQEDFVSNDTNNPYGIMNGILVLPFKAKSNNSTEKPTIIYDSENDLYLLKISPDHLRKTDTVNIKTEQATGSIVETTDAEGNTTSTAETVSDDSSTSQYFNIGQFYKVQIRFDKGLFENNSPVSEVSSIYGMESIVKNPGSALEEDKQKYNILYNNYMIYARQYFSEWSEVTLIRPIYPMVINFADFDEKTYSASDDSIGDNTPQFQKGLVNISARVEFKDTLNGTVIGSGNSQIIIPNNGLFNENEHLERYRVRVFDAILEEPDIEKDKPFYDTDIIYAEPTKLDDNNFEYGINCLIDMHHAKPGGDYLLVVDIWSNNEYYKQETRSFKIDVFEEGFAPPRWNQKRKNGEYYKSADWLEVNQEDGVVNIDFSWEALEDIESSILNGGIIYIKRACSKDGILPLTEAKTGDAFLKWQVIYLKELTTEDHDPSFTFQDYTICSLYEYVYCAQFKPKGNNAQWSKMYYSQTVYPQFYEMLLERQNRQIAIRYDGKISALKPVVNRQKIDTLGGRYPKFVENAQMNYKQLSLQGIISAEGDFNRKFLNEFDGENVTVYANDETTDTQEKYQYYYQNDIKEYNVHTDKPLGHYLLRNDTFPDGELGRNPKDEGEELGPIDHYSPKNNSEYDFGSVYNDTSYEESIFNDNEHNPQDFLHDFYLTDHWFWERVFREELTKWLNDGEPKLFRSMPEGNIAVMLTDINLTPAVPDRKIYNFSATMYEVGDGYSLDDLDRLGIIDIPKLATRFISSDGNSDSEDDDTNHFGKTLTVVGQFFKIKDYILRKSIIENSSNAPIVWEDCTIADKYTQIYARNSTKGGKVAENFRIRDVRIQFTSPPRWYYMNGQSLTRLSYDPDDNKNLQPITLDADGNPVYPDKDFDDTPLFLGYTFMMTTESAIAQEPIFVNERGYYQIPADTKVTSLIFEDDSDCMVDYILEYEEYNAAQTTPISRRVIKTIVGQWGGVYPVNTAVGASIYKKYELDRYQLANPNSTENHTINPYDRIFHQELQNFAGVTFDVSPYSIVAIKYVNDDEWQRLVVGRTGVLSLPNQEIEDIKFLGRQIFSVDSSRQPFLDEWECVVSDEEIEPTQYTWFLMDDEGITRGPVPHVYLYEEDGIGEGVPNEVFQEWANLNSDGSSSNIPSTPLINNVYRITKTDGTVEHWIYFLDHRWYEVKSESGRAGVYYAAVPVYGYINYTGKVVRSDYQ